MKNKEFNLLVRKFCRDNGLKLGDLKEILRELDIEASSGDSETSFLESSKPPKELQEFHHHLVQESINFLKSNPEIWKKLEDRRDELGKIWNEGVKESHHITPDLRIQFSADCLWASVGCGEWTPYTDSYLGLEVGRDTIMFSM